MENTDKNNDDVALPPCAYVDKSRSGATYVPFVPGATYFIDQGSEHRFYVGKVTAVTDKHIRMEKVYWVKSRGDIGKFFKTKNVEKNKKPVEVNKPQMVHVGAACFLINSIVFFTNWPEAGLPSA